MIDWPSIGSNALWIVGCATIVAAFSYAYWLAELREDRIRHMLGTPPLQLSFSIGFLLIALGLFFLSQSWPERALWTALTLLFAWQAWSIR